MFNKVKVNTTQEKMEIPANEIPTIEILYEAIVKMDYIVQNTKSEVGWLGSAVKTSDKIVIEDVYLLKQKVHETTCELMPDAINDFFSDLKKEKGMEAWSKIKVWGHSHVDMPAQPSGQDDETFAEYYKDNSFFIRLICNKKGDMKIDLADKERGVIYKNLPFTIIYPMEIEKLLREIQQIESTLEQAWKCYETKADKLKEKFSASLEKELKEKVTSLNESKTFSGKEVYPYISKAKIYDSGVQNVLDDYEIFDVSCCANWKDVKDYFEDDVRFEYYKKKDWERLRERCLKIMENDYWNYNEWEYVE